MKAFSDFAMNPYFGYPDSQNQRQLAYFMVSE